MATSATTTSPVVALSSGAVAGIITELTIFPIDSIKTRMQSGDGFFKSGGFRHLYRGVSAVFLSSAPDAALFFGTYETLKIVLAKYAPKGIDESHPITHFCSSAAAELVACSVRAPVDQIRQRVQAGQYKGTWQAIQHLWMSNRSPLSVRLRRAYRGYLPTAARDVPFSFIQLPIYEFLKVELAKFVERDLAPFEAACCGAAAGSFAGLVTTPLDVTKTRIMLGRPSALGTSYRTFGTTIRTIYSEEGARTLFRGATARVAWMGTGAFILFGAFHATRGVLMGDRPELVLAQK